MAEFLHQFIIRQKPNNGIAALLPTCTVLKGPRIHGLQKRLVVGFEYHFTVNEYRFVAIVYWFDANEYPFIAIGYSFDANRYRVDVKEYWFGANEYPFEASGYRVPVKAYRFITNQYRFETNRYRSEANGYRFAINGYRFEANQYPFKPNRYQNAPNLYPYTAYVYRVDTNGYTFRPKAYLFPLFAFHPPLDISGQFTVCSHLFKGRPGDPQVRPGFLYASKAGAHRAASKKRRAARHGGPIYWLDTGLFQSKV